MSMIYTISEHRETTLDAQNVTYSIVKNVTDAGNNTRIESVAAGLKRGYAQLIADLLNNTPPNRDDKNTLNVKTAPWDRYSVRKPLGAPAMGIWFVDDGEITVACTYTKFYAYRIARLINDKLANKSLPPDIVEDNFQLVKEHKRLTQDIQVMNTGIDKLKARLTADPKLSHASARVPILGDITLDRRGHIGNDFFAGIAEEHSKPSNSKHLSLWASLLKWLKQNRE